MMALIDAVETGIEKRRAVNEAVEKMKAYLERREEYGVGSWVHQVRLNPLPASDSSTLPV